MYGRVGDLFFILMLHYFPLFHAGNSPCLYHGDLSKFSSSPAVLVDIAKSEWLNGEQASEQGKKGIRNVNEVNYKEMFANISFYEERKSA